MKNSPPTKLYRHPLSGHCHRVELFLSILKRPVELIDIDLAAGAHKAPDFLKLNPFGQVPAIQDGDLTLWDSNAILVYLAERYADGAWLPSDPKCIARVQQWLSVAAGPLAHGPARARLATVFGADIDIDAAQSTATALLRVLEKTLKTNDFVAGGPASIADLALYAYVAHAPEGNVSLDGYPAVNAWLKRIENLPGFVAMQATPVGMAA